MTAPTTPLRRALAGYLSIRRSLGFTLARDEKLLAQFIDYLQARAATTITVEHATAWATLPANGSPSWWGFRMSVVRGFASWLHTLDPATQIPPAGLLPSRSHRAVPYLYSERDITALIEAAGGLRYPLGVATYRTLIGLLAVTGMRIGEAIRLDGDDFDPGQRLLVVRHSKLGNSRQLPLHPTTASALHTYLHRREQLAPRPQPNSPAVFISTAGTRLRHENVSVIFNRLVRRAGIPPRSASCRPRLHDLRHSFSVRTLLGWYADGGDVQARLPLLSTYLGHSDPANTYWYLQAAPELLALAGARLEAHLDGRR